MSAILFGSISTLADTSELQRRAFNDAFSAHDLDWSWDRETYRSMLDTNGGADRVAAYASQRGDDVDAAAIHATKTARFQELVAEEGIHPRPGVVDLVQVAKAEGIAVGIVTTTSPDNVGAVLEAVGVTRDQLDLVLDRDQVDAPKPDPEVYRLALAQLGVPATDCLAIEDNPGGVASATAAGITTVAFPNANTDHLDLSGADTTVTELDAPALLTRLAG